MCFADSPKTKNDLLEGSYKRKSKAIQKILIKELPEFLLLTNFVKFTGKPLCEK